MDGWLFSEEMLQFFKDGNCKFSVERLTAQEFIPNRNRSNQTMDPSSGIAVGSPKSYQIRSIVSNDWKSLLSSINGSILAYCVQMKASQNIKPQPKSIVSKIGHL